MRTIFIGAQFSDDPSGRFYTDGDGSGEEFREEVLLPLLEKEDKLVINISKDVEGYGSSFLSEAFGGLVKYGYYCADKALSKIEIQVDSNSLDYVFYKNKIIQYIKASSYASSKYKSTKEIAKRQGKFKGVINKGFVVD